MGPPFPFLSSIRRYVILSRFSTSFCPSSQIGPSGTQYSVLSTQEYSGLRFQTNSHFAHQCPLLDRPHHLRPEQTPPTCYPRRAPHIAPFIMCAWLDVMVTAPACGPCIVVVARILYHRLLEQKFKNLVWLITTKMTIILFSLIYNHFFIIFTVSSTGAQTLDNILGVGRTSSNAMFPKCRKDPHPHLDS